MTKKFENKRVTITRGPMAGTHAFCAYESNSDWLSVETADGEIHRLLKGYVELWKEPEIMAIRRLGKKKRLFGGWERKDTIKVKNRQGREIPLIGYVKVLRKNKETKTTTHYKDRVVEGFDPRWLAARNSRIYKGWNDKAAKAA